MTDVQRQIANLSQDGITVDSDAVAATFPDGSLWGWFRTQQIELADGVITSPWRRHYLVNALADFAGDTAGSRILIASIVFPGADMNAVALRDERLYSAGGNVLRLDGPVHVPEHAQLQFFVGQEDAEGAVTASLSVDIWELFQ
jgi:hypothetical protein